MKDRRKQIRIMEKIKPLIKTGAVMSYADMKAGRQDQIVAIALAFCNRVLRNLFFGAMILVYSIVRKAREPDDQESSQNTLKNTGINGSAHWNSICASAKIRSLSFHIPREAIIKITPPENAP